MRGGPNLDSGKSKLQPLIAGPLLKECVGEDPQPLASEPFWRKKIIQKQQITKKIPKRMR